MCNTYSIMTHERQFRSAKNGMQSTIMKDCYQIFRFNEFQIIDVNIVMPNPGSK